MNIGALIEISDSQKDNTSIAEQKKRIQAYCTSQDWKLKQFFVDEAKSSSEIDERFEYARMHEFARNQNNQIAAIVLTEYKRMQPQHVRELNKSKKLPWSESNTSSAISK